MWLYLRLKKYQHTIDSLKEQLEQTMTLEHISMVTTTIRTTAQRQAAKRKAKLQTKLLKLNPRNKEAPEPEWVINMSSRPLSTAEHNILQRGLNYNTEDANKLEFFAAFEAALKTTGLTIETQENVRQIIIPQTRRTCKQDQLKAEDKAALKNLKMDQTIVILPADKGRTTVIMDKSQYIHKAKELLEDKGTYTLINTNPIQKLDNKVKRMLNDLTKKGQISKDEQRWMKSSGPILPRFYGRPKIHKPDIPLRPIVSLPGTPTYNIAKELTRKLKHLTEESDYSINSPLQCLQKIKDVKIEDDEIMVSFDVTALFTSIDPALAKESMAAALQNTPDLVKYTKIEIPRIMELKYGSSM